MAPTPTTDSTSPSYFAAHREDRWGESTCTLQHVVAMTGAALGRILRVLVEERLSSLDCEAYRRTSFANTFLMSAVLYALDPSAQLDFDPTLFDVMERTIETLLAPKHRPFFNSFLRRTYQGYVNRYGHSTRVSKGPVDSGYVKQLTFSTERFADELRKETVLETAVLIKLAEAQ